MFAKYIYFLQATTQCGNLDVRLLIKPRDNIRKIKTNRKIDVILYDADIIENVNELQNSLQNVDNISIQKVPIPKIGKNIHNIPTHLHKEDIVSYVTVQTDLFF